MILVVRLEFSALDALGNYILSTYPFFWSEEKKCMQLKGSNMPLGLDSFINWVGYCLLCNLKGPWYYCLCIQKPEYYASGMFDSISKVQLKARFGLWVYFSVGLKKTQAHPFRFG